MKFKRITDNKISAKTLEQFYDEIRMRDSEGHPSAYIDYDSFRILFRRASLRKDCVEADVKILLR